MRDSKQQAVTKPPMHLLPLDGLWLAAIAMALGEAKGYLRRSWQAAEDPEIYLGAHMRHMTAVLNGEETDEEGNNHLGAAIASLLIFAWHWCRGFRVKRHQPQWVVDDGHANGNGSARSDRRAQVEEGAAGRANGAA